jgi:signal transduction histidine kinase
MSVPDDPDRLRRLTEARCRLQACLLEADGDADDLRSRFHATWLEALWALDVPLDRLAPELVDSERLLCAGGNEPAIDDPQLGPAAELAPLLAVARRRLQELARLQATQVRDRTDAAVQEVRAAVLAMQDPEDWAQVVRTTASALQPLVPFWSCSINLVDLEADTLTAFGVDGEGGLERHLIRGVHPAVRQAVQTSVPIYRRTREDPLFDPGFIARLHSVLDVPFRGGTLAVNAEAESAFSDEHIRVLERFAAVVAEGHLRQTDLESLRQREAQLLQVRLLESLGQLAGGVAHQLNNPLMAITGYSELLLQRLGDDETTRQDLEVIIAEARRAHRLAERLVEFARRQTGGRRELSLNQLANDAVELLRRPDEGPRVEMELDDDLPPVVGQPGELQQLLLALVDNALRQPAGCVHVQSRTHGSAVRLEVTDDGGGVPEDVRARMFEPFYTTRRKINAVGLGLSLALRIAHAHDGRLWHEPVPGGARFVLELPASGSGAENVGGEAPAAGGSSPT